MAKHGLLPELLHRLSLAGNSISTGAHAATPGGSMATPDAKTNSNGVSTVISLLSTLCRGSPTISTDLLQMDLPQAIENALQGDERLSV